MRHSYTYIVGCKINIGLHIGERMDNGYHEVRSLLYPIPNPHDVMTIIQEPSKEPHLIIKSNQSFLCKENILYKAYNLITSYLVEHGIEHNYTYTILLEKNIPIGGGLGGGSANAGCFLRHFGVNFSEYFSDAVLYKIARKLGADVPFFLYNKPYKVQGIGDILEETSYSLSDMHCLILEFSHKIETKQAYQDLDNFRKNNKKNLTVNKKYSKSYSGLRLMNQYDTKNDFEEVLFSRYTQMKTCKENMLNGGAIISGVSGSGSSMFGIFRDKHSSNNAEKSIRSMVNNLYRSVL